MRKNFLYLFYAVTSVFILLALNQDFNMIRRTTSSTEPQYVFTQPSNDNAETRQQEDMKIILQWAQGYDPDSKSKYE
ncbi:hypothetical protein [Vibrio algarum]|uniref:Uncharacterized protein n=1 Tax=Vibrio algarum TaxID=3020714 RepID=A0ABT4YVY9_9VIBR|nr:hypothetical protein [Vibrio sp. KJ40-1]MDB1125158.1 hypothetical protein [Vibrio sp. KJ40-1]